MQLPMFVVYCGTCYFHSQSVTISNMLQFSLEFAFTSLLSYTSGVYTYVASINPLCYFELDYTQLG